MASNRSALEEAPTRTAGAGTGTGTAVRYGSWFEPAAKAGADQDTETWEEWNPTEDSIAPVRGRHRVPKQRGGTMARSGAVLGVGVIAAVGAGGMASAKDRPKAPISMPDLGHIAGQVQDALPDAEELPGIGSLLSDSDSGSDSGGSSTATPLSTAGLTSEDEANGATDAGEALRARILQQAENQQNAADASQREAAADAAADQAAAAAKKAAAAETKRQAEAEAKKKAAEAEAKRKAEEAARKKAEAERLAKLAAQYSLPVASYTLTASFGQAGDMWSADHTGQDFAAPTGTPVKAVHGGTITSAGWAGSYGYRIVLKLNDGTEIWYCHLSSMVRTSGSVTTGEVIGRVGATGNVTGPHLHLEVRPGGGSPINPMPWLRDHGLNP